MFQLSSSRNIPFDYCFHNWEVPNDLSVLYQGKAFLHTLICIYSNTFEAIVLLETSFFTSSTCSSVSVGSIRYTCTTCPSLVDGFVTNTEFADCIFVFKIRNFNNMNYKASSNVNSTTVEVTAACFKTVDGAVVMVTFTGCCKGTAVIVFLPTLPPSAAALLFAFDIRALA